MQSERFTHLIGEVTKMLYVLCLNTFFSLLSTLHFALFDFFHHPPRSRYRHPVRTWRIIASRSVLKQDRPM